MKILNIEQRSDEWLAFREGKITGTKAKEYSKPNLILKDDLIAFANSKGYIDFPKSLTIAKIREMMKPEELEELDYTVKLNDSIYKLIAENIAKPINPNDYELGGRQFSMALRGEIMEAEAREKTAEKLGKNITAGRLWQSEENSNIICSPDGEILDADGKITEALEIKCLDSWKCVKAFYEKHPPTEYKDQIVQYFLVNEDLKTLYFTIYSDVFPLTPKIGHQIYELKREDYEEDIARAKKMQEAVLSFVNQEITRLTF